MQNALQTAVRFNNRGVSLFASGYVIEAMQSIRNAVRAMAEFNLNLCTGTTPISFQMILGTFGSADDNNNMPKPPQPITHHTIYCDLFAEHYDDIFIYGRPLIIPNADVSTRDDVIAYARISSTYIVFNLAMACHFHGLVTGTSTFLVRAMELYQGVLSRNSHYCDIRGNILNDGMNAELFQCLILNNLAHLHRIFGEYYSSAWCMECIKDFIVSGRYRNEGFLSSDEAKEIKLNLMFAACLTTASAA